MIIIANAYITYFSCETERDCRTERDIVFSGYLLDRVGTTHITMVETRNQIRRNRVNDSGGNRRILCPTPTRTSRLRAANVLSQPLASTSTPRSNLNASGLPTVGNLSINPTLSTNSAVSTTPNLTDVNRPATVQDLQTCMNELAARLESHFDSKFNELANFVDWVADEVAALGDRVADLEDAPPPDTCEIATSVLNELHERNRCTKNVLILGLNELEDLTADLAQVNTLLVNVTGAPVLTNARRMGRVIPDRVRPLKVFLNSPDEANTLIANKAIFANNNLKIVRDSTLMERNYLSDLRAELNYRIANGEPNITIKYQNGLSRIVQKNV